LACRIRRVALDDLRPAPALQCIGSIYSANLPFSDALRMTFLGIGNVAQAPDFPKETCDLLHVELAHAVRRTTNSAPVVFPSRARIAAVGPRQSEFRPAANCIRSHPETKTTTWCSAV